MSNRNLLAATAMLGLAAFATPASAQEQTGIKEGDVLLRARSFADSRVVCGAHNLSAIQAGQINGSAIVARLHAEPAFQADMAAAREELAALRAAGTPVDGGQCAAEHALIEQAPY